MSLGRLFNFRQVAEVAGNVDEETVRRWTKRKVNPLPTIRMSQTLVRVSETHLTAWLVSQVRA